MASAWTFQKPADVKKRGEANATWYCGWYEPDGNRKSQGFGPGVRGKDLAERHRRKIETALMTGQYECQLKVTWEDFRKEYEEKILPGLALRTREEIKAALDHFERLVKPRRLFTLATSQIDTFIAARRKEPGKKKGSLASPATINKELRHIRAVLAKAQEWKYTPTVPKFNMEKVPKKIPGYVTGEHFAAIYAACDAARFPADLPHVKAADWWRGLLVFGYMTGWRIGEILSLRREDLDLAAGRAKTEAEDNKGGRDAWVDLHPVILDHLRRLPVFDDLVFPWNYYKTTLYAEFATIQEKAGVKLPCRIRDQHEHSRFCYVYGFHDLRRAFATMNADRLTGDALQTLMRHKSYSTTQLYINLAPQMKEAVDRLHVPEFLRMPTIPQADTGTDA